jgi:hypothetical protein
MAVPTVEWTRRLDDLAIIAFEFASFKSWLISSPESCFTKQRLRADAIAHYVVKVRCRRVHPQPVSEFRHRFVLSRPAIAERCDIITTKITILTPSY